jgi:GNAT superfamily N-acetyltransferase
MTLEIRSYSADLLEGICMSFNRMTVAEPDINPFTPETFAAYIASKSYFDPNGMGIATKGGEIVGWVHACVAGGTETWNSPQPSPRISMLVFAPDRPDVGGALLEHAGRWLGDSQSIEALGSGRGYPFYRGLWCGGEPMGLATHPQVQMALEIQGYKTIQQSVLMIAVNIFAAVHELPVGLTIDDGTLTMSDRLRESWVGFIPRESIAYWNGEVVGFLHWVVLPGVEQRRPDCLNIFGLHVDDSVRRRGIATSLIAHTIQRARYLGASRASLCTQLSNRWAQSMYARFGFTPSRLLIGRERSAGH